MIKWISVFDELPKDQNLVLAICKGEDDKVYTFIFDPSNGWIPQTESASCDRCRTNKVMYWSKYNLPK